MNRLQKMGNELIFKNKISHKDINNEHEIQYKIKSINGNQVTINTNKSDNVFLLPTYFSNNQIISTNQSPSSISKVINSSTIVISENPDNKSLYMIQKGFRKFYNNVRFQYKF